MRKIFVNTRIAFSLKSTPELKKAHFLFRIMSWSVLVKVVTKLTKALLKLGFPIKGLIRKTIFNQFCGGITEEECILAAQRIGSMNVHAILDYSIEGKETEEEFDSAMNHKCRLITLAKNNPEIIFAVMKPTALGRFETWQNASEKKELSPEQAEEWRKVVLRFETICEKAFKDNVPLLIDAEESWIQDAVDELAIQMMAKYNREEAIIHNTIQCYRHDRLAYTKKLFEEAKKEMFIAGVKIVRGAYMEKENKRAKKNGYETPICKDKFATDYNFNTILRYIMENIFYFSLFIGSHNEKSTYLALQIMIENTIRKNDYRVWFGQLYGMGDHISFNLGKAGYNVIKLIPFGPVKEVIPYLIRRAQENTSVAGQTGRELALIEQEIDRRKYAKYSP